MSAPDSRPAGDPDDSELPFVSVVVPVFRDPVGIARVLDALLEQRYPQPSWEIIVVDNGSDDRTRATVERYQERAPGRIRLEVEAAVQSSYAARNRGIRVARGSILAFTDADCVPGPRWLEQGVRALERESAAYAAGRIDMTFLGPEPNLWEYYDAVGKLNQRHYMEDYGFGATANLFVRRSALDAHGLFRDDLMSSGDYELGRRLARAGERGVYAHDAVVRHPARATAHGVLSKERRIARGRRHLEELDLLDHGRLTWRSFLPVRRCPSLEGTRPGPLRRVALLGIFNLVRYYILGIRLADRLRPARTPTRP